MAVTIDEIKALDFGYLTGADLLKFCAFQLIQKQYTVDETSIETSVNLAYSEMKSCLSSRYDVTEEFAKTGSARYSLVVKMTAIMAVRNLCGDLAAVPENMNNNFKWVDDSVLDIRNGQLALGLKMAPTAKISNTSLITSNFETLS
jgi:hypothetical protein